MDLKQESTTVLSTLLEHMELGGEVIATEDDERVSLEVTGEETGLVIGKKGQTLDALQYLVNKIVSRIAGEEETKPIQLDAEGYRSRRAEALTELANRLAEKAIRTGQPVEVEPMSAGDRRVIHMALTEVSGVTTQSEGEGIYRHLVIIPTAE